LVSYHLDPHSYVLRVSSSSRTTVYGYEYAGNAVVFSPELAFAAAFLGLVRNHDLRFAPGSI
jgi:hypothetical protein